MLCISKYKTSVYNQAQILAYMDAVRKVDSNQLFFQGLMELKGLLSNCSAPYQGIGAPED